MRARFLTSVVAGLVVVLASGTTALADDRPGGGAYVDGGGAPTAVAGEGTEVPGGGSTGGGSGGSGPPCEWRVIIEDDFEAAIYSLDTLEMQHSATGRWLQYWCEGIGAVDVNGYYIIPEGGLVDPAALAQEALESVEIAAPEIRTSPSEDGQLYVQLPTWLWIDAGWWHTYTATANAGRVWSTVKARPVSVSWTTGDGGSVPCGGPGTPWSPGAPEDGSNCTHTYRHSSAEDGSYSLSAAVTFEVTWTSNIADGGTLETISRTSTVDVEVGEIQAIGTGG